MFLEELNRRIRENGINLRLSCIYLFQNISRQPDHCHKTQRTSLSFRITRIYLVTQTTFSGILESLSHSQHSVNAHTKPLSEKQSLSESFWGLIRSYQT